MAETIAVLSQKGGTGKTTTVRTLTDILRRLGLSVLAVDLDPQGNLSDYFDVDPDASPTIAEVLTGGAKAADAIHDDVLPANLGLAEAELVLGGKMGRELSLRPGTLVSIAGRLVDPQRRPVNASFSAIRWTDAPRATVVPTLQTSTLASKPSCASMRGWRFGPDPLEDEPLRQRAVAV